MKKLIIIGLVIFLCLPLAAYIVSVIERGEK